MSSDSPDSPRTAPAALHRPLALPEPSGGAPLVNAHTAPQGLFHRGSIALYQGRIDLSPSRPRSLQGRIGGGLRGKVGHFSYASRRRMMKDLAAIKGDHYQTMLFLTLTYHNDWKGRAPRKDLDVYLKRLRRRFPGLAYVWRLEPQERGAPHFHLLLFFEGRVSEEEKADIKCQWHELVDPDSLWHGEYGAKVEADLDGRTGLRIYISKYCAKPDATKAKPEWWQGRYWSTSRNLERPLMEERTLTESEEIELKRIMAKWIETSSKRSLKAATNRDQHWAARRKLRYANVVKAEGIKCSVMLKEEEEGMRDEILRFLDALQSERGDFPTTPYALVKPRSLRTSNRGNQSAINRYSRPNYITPIARRAYFQPCAIQPRFSKTIQYLTP